jgi:hypothetical protein
MSDLQKRIKEIKEDLQNREDTDPAYLSEDMKELRHWVMYTHLRVEQTLQVILGHNIFKLEFKKENLVQIIDNFKKVYPIFDNMEFYPKVKVIQTLNLLPKDLISLILKVNDHRKYFSHPATYVDIINEYKNEEKQLQTLIELQQVLNELDKYVFDNKLFIPSK